MTRRTLLLVAALALMPVLVVFLPSTTAQTPANRLAPRLSAQEFSTLMTELSEADGFFRSDNLVSNELFMQRVIPDLTRVVKPGGVYLGVGPEQNFTYIAAVKPAMAFIIDVRRGNLQLHLMYKALFELSSDRADFVSRLFSLKRPPRLDRSSSVQDIFTAYKDPGLKSLELYKQNLSAIKRLFARKNGLGLSPEDLTAIEGIYQAFYSRGLEIHYEVTPGSAGSFPTYADLMVATDGASVPRSYLATEEHFALIKDLHSRNLIVPVVGNFGGPKTIRAVGKYIRARNAVVSAFYVSNVEQYLLRADVIDAFCASAASLPLDESSTFIRSERGGLPSRGGGGSPRGGFGGNFNSKVRDMIGDLKSWYFASYFSKNALRFSRKLLRLRSSPSVSFLNAS